MMEAFYLPPHVFGGAYFHERSVFLAINNFECILTTVFAVVNTCILFLPQLRGLGSVPLLTGSKCDPSVFSTLKNYPSFR